MALAFKNHDNYKSSLEKQKLLWLFFFLNAFLLFLVIVYILKLIKISSDNFFIKAPQWGKNIG